MRTNQIKNLVPAKAIAAASSRRALRQAVGTSLLGLSLSTALTAANAAPTDHYSPAKASVPGVNRVTGLEVTSDENGTHILIEGTQRFTPDVRALSGSRTNGTMINTPGLWSAGKAGTVLVKRNGVVNVRCGQFSDRSGGTVRIVANTLCPLAHTLAGSPDGRHWEVTVWAPGVIPNAPAPERSVAITTSGRLSKPLAAPVALPAQIDIAPAAARPIAKARAVADAANKANTDAAAVMAEPASPQPAAVKSAPVVSMSRKAPEPSINQIDRHVSLDFVGADINDVLKALALQSGVNIVTGADVKGNITVSLKQVSLNEALDMVTRLSGFKYAKFGPTFVVGSPASVASIVGSEASVVPVEPRTEFIPFRYNTMGSVVRVLNDRFPGMKLPVVDPKEDLPFRPKTLIITDQPERVAAVRKFVEQMEQAVSVPTVVTATEVYRVHYASSTDLIEILGNLVPTLSVSLGPKQGFVSGSSGSSASYSSGAAPAAPAAGGSGGAGGASPSGAASSGNAPNTLLMTGVPSDIVRARDILKQIDIQSPQISYEARVMDLNNQDSEQLGLRYDFSKGVNIGEIEGNKDGVVGSIVNGAASTNARDLNFGSIFRTPYAITTNLDALAKNNHAKTLARPNLSALDGQPAVVFIGDQIKYVINIQQTQQGQNIQTETATVGITLKVTGKASPDGTITLYVHPEVSVVSSYLTLSSGISLPQISTRYVDTTIRVKDGETIAIGGLIQDQDVKNIQKIPLLGDIPFFGQLFRDRTTQKNHSEIVVFITSRVLKD